MKQNTISEIAKGLGCPVENNLSRQELSEQAIAALHILHKVIQAASQAKPSFESLIIHPPFRDASLDDILPDGINQTMHAEQNIQKALAGDKEFQYQELIAKLGLQEGKHVIVPIAGKYVPCATCSEVESEAKGWMDYLILIEESLYCIDQLSASGWLFGMRCNILPSKVSMLIKKKRLPKVLLSEIVFMKSLKNYRLRIERWWRIIRLIRIVPVLTTPPYNFTRPLAH